jgi:hypothetical protein
MKTKSLIIVLTIVLVSCAPASTPMPTMTDTPYPTATAIPEPTETYTPEPTVTPNPTKTPRPTATPSSGLCPIDMSLPGVYILAESSSSHEGLDIGGPYGTLHQSPDNCNVIELYTGLGQQTGQQGIILQCPGLSYLGVYRITLGHVDFSYNEYDTLKFYGIPKSRFFNQDGSVIPGQLGVMPNTNRYMERGENLHIYLACTGFCYNNHTHITIWDSSGSGNNDPKQFLDCKKQR